VCSRRKVVEPELKSEGKQTALPMRLAWGAAVAPDAHLLCALHRDGEDCRAIKSTGRVSDEVCKMETCRFPGDSRSRSSPSMPSRNSPMASRPAMLPPLPPELRKAAC
jgi:hypothetical protein